MSRGPLRFRQHDVERALKALRAAGVSIARVEIGTEGVVIIPGEPAPSSIDADKAERELDEMVRRSARRRH
jgi:hypothetical protein